MLAVIARTQAGSLSKDLILPAQQAGFSVCAETMKIRFVMFQVSICGDEHIPVYIITFLTNFTFLPPPTRQTRCRRCLIASLARLKSFGRSPSFQTYVKRSRRSLYRWGVDVPGLGQYDGEQHPIRSAVPTFPLKLHIAARTNYVPESC
jgi:hypothetical protein